MACPITTAHGRLNEAHRLWHQAADAYQEPEAFRTNLNAAIQALRNVTFALQKEHRSVPGFEEWYPRWRTRLAEDPICLWIVDARNRIVKQSDLDLESKATAVLQTYDDLAAWEKQVPPAMALDAIAEECRNSLLPSLPPALLEVAVLSVERRWVVPEIPNEVLEALAHCYRALAELLREAHERAGVDSARCGRVDPIHKTGLGLGDLPCLFLGREERTARLVAGTGEALLLKLQRYEYSKERGQCAAQHYGLAEPLRPKSSSADDMLAWAIELSRLLLTRDKALQWSILLLMPDGTWQPSLMTMPEDQVSKHALMQIIATLIDTSRASGLLCVGEGWIRTVEEFRAGRKATREGISIVLALESGEVRHTLVPFTRGPGGEILLQPASEMDAVAPYWLQPVLAVWKKRAATAPAKQP